MELVALQAPDGRWFRIGVDPYYLTQKAEEMSYQPQVILDGCYGQHLEIILTRHHKQQSGGSCERIKIWGVKVAVTGAWADRAEVKHEYSI